MPTDFVPWTRKYNPKRLADIEGHASAIEELRKFITHFKKGKALLLYGESGGGKTSSVYALAHELDLELIEINASDTRNADQIDLLLGNASKQMSLFFKSKIILVDELDGIAGREDRGGVQAIQRLVESSTFPIILVANDPYVEKLSSLRKKAVMLEFKTRPYTSILNYLKKICKEEKISYDEEALSMLSRSSGGDMRAAINDLQSLAANDKKLTRKEVEAMNNERDRTESIIQALVKVLKTTDVEVALKAFDNVNEDLDKIFLWMEENLPYEYTRPADLARGFDALSKADVFKGRIIRWQHFRFYVYCYNLLSAGVAVAKDEKYKSFISYKPTTRILKLWIAKQRNLKKKAIAEKIADKTHTSKKRALQDTLPYLKPVFKKSKKEAERLTAYLELDNEQVEWMAR
jgi:replication factor C large subunit